MSIAPSVKAKAVTDFQRHEKDSGSPEVQISVLTTRIANLTDHLKNHAQDHHNRRGLIMMVGKRNRLLKYLARTDRPAYQQTIGRLGLRK